MRMRCARVTVAQPHHRRHRRACPGHPRLCSLTGRRGCPAIRAFTPVFRRAMAGHDDVEIMPDHFDSLETRDPAVREKDLFARLPAQIAHAMSAPGWAKHLAGVDPKSVASRAALAKLPLLRKSALL